MAAFLSRPQCVKGPAHMAEGGHHLRKAPNPHPLDTTQVVEILPHVRQERTCPIYIVNIVGADALATQTLYLLCWTGSIRSPHVKG